MKGKKLTKEHSTPGSKQIQVNDGGQGGAGSKLRPGGTGGRTEPMSSPTGMDRWTPPVPRRRDGGLQILLFSWWVSLFITIAASVEGRRLQSLSLLVCRSVKSVTASLWILRRPTRRLSPRPGGPISILFRHWCPDPVSEEFWMSLWKNLDAYARGRRQILSGCGPVLACHHSPCCTWGGGWGWTPHPLSSHVATEKKQGGESTKFWGGHADGLSRTAEVAMGRRATHRWS